jgi:hypothetical protein
MKKLLKRLFVAGAVTLASAFPMKEAKALDGNIEYVHSENNACSYPRGNFFYDLPSKVKGYSWVELYKGGNGYFGETNLEKEVSNGFSVATQLQHCNTPLNRAGFGVSRQIPTPKGTLLKLSAYPIWFDKDGKQENSELAYFTEAGLPLGMKFSSFGDWNLADKNGVQWGYGEIDLRKDLYKGVSLGYNPALLNNGNAVPKVEHRATVRINF